MDESLTHTNYSFEDIQRYLNGGMSASEMHNIEKAALQDPFLADAIEGFNEADLLTARQHLNEINTALIKEKKESKVIAFNKKTQWLNVAAVIIVLAGIGVLLSYILNTSKSGSKNQVAQIKTEAAATKTQKDSVITDANTFTKKQDTNLLVAENKPVKKVPSFTEEKNAKEPIAANNTIMQNDETNSLSNADVTSAPAIVTNSKSLTAADKSMNNFDSVQSILNGKINLPATFSGKVINESNKPVSGALIETADKKAAVITDINGNFSLVKNDSALNVTASTAGYNTRMARLQSGNNNSIVLQETSSLNDVVTVGYGNATQRKVLPDSAMPVGGWQNFNHYVLSQLNTDSTMAVISNAHDLVELEFFIDNNGNPYNIKPTKGLDEERNTKAIEILKNGPKWMTTSKKKRAKVSITIPQP